MPNYRAFYKIIYEFREEDMDDAHGEAECLLYDLREENPDLEFKLETIEEDRQ